MRFCRPGLAVLGVLLIGAMSGCGGDDPLGRRAVSGIVTLDEVPLEEGSISFEPMDGGRTSSGGVIRNGRYVIARDQGLPPGKYRVEIHAVKPGTGMKRPPGGGIGSETGTPAVELIPPGWNQRSEHFVEVTASSSAEFNHEILTTQKR